MGLAAFCGPSGDNSVPLSVPLKLSILVMDIDPASTQGRTDVAEGVSCGGGFSRFR